MSGSPSQQPPPQVAHFPAVPGLVTIHIPTHNRAALLERAVDSALAQTDPNVEVVVVSDGSTDQTDNRMAARSHAESRLRYLRLAHPGGACAARNHAIRHARGQFVTGLDDDDTLAPEHIARLRAAYRPSLSLVAASQLVVYPDRQVPSQAGAGTVTLDSLLHYNKLGNHAFAERDRVLSVGAFDEQLPAFQDYDLWVRLVARYGPARKLSDVTYHVHIDHGMPRISGSMERRKRALAQFVERHRELMTPAHLRSMELLTLKHSGAPLRLGTAARLLRPGNEKSVLSLLINTRAPWIQRMYHRVIARS